ncbi:MAG: S8 family serine peptidase [Micropepsaceae bacterium]
MSISARLALLALGVSAFAVAANAETAASRWFAADDLLQDDDWNAVDPLTLAEVYVAHGVVVPTALTRTRPVPKPPRPTPTPGLGGPVIVAVIDSGIDLDHPEFLGRIGNGICFGSCTGDAVRGDDDNGHGTHVAGIIGAASDGTGTTGVAPNSILLPIKILDSTGFGDTDTLQKGVRAAVTARARVINMSLGGPAGSAPLLSSLQYASQTAVLVAAAGNNGLAQPDFPAAYATTARVVGSMIIVGSVDDSNVISAFSNTPGDGGCMAVGRATTCFKDVFLVAPGENITSTFPGGGYFVASGTSMATPYVSGVAARVLSAAPYLTPKQVVSILLSTATDLGATGTDSVYGRGLVNLTAALAPVGLTSIATSGASTAQFAGTGVISQSGLSGALGMGLRGSQVAKDAMFFDGYGRDYRTDLTASITSPAVSLEGLVSQTGLFRSVTFAGDGYSVSGFVGDVAPNMVATAGLANEEPVALNDVVLRASLTDDLSVTAGHNASLEGRVNALDLAASSATSGLFISASAMNSPYLGLTDSAMFAAGSVRIGDDFTLTAGHALSEPEDRSTADRDPVRASLTQDATHVRAAGNSVVSASWRFAPWGLAGVNAAYTTEDNSMLGGHEQGALALTSDAATASIGAGARVNLGGNWVVNASWNRGETQATPLANALLRSVSAVASEAYGLAVSKRGVFGEADTLGFAVSRPLHITSGSAVVTASTGVSEAREIVYTTEIVSLASVVPETDYELGYTAKLGDVTALQVSAIYQQDAGGQAGADAVAAFVSVTTTW